VSESAGSRTLLELIDSLGASVVVLAASKDPNAKVTFLLEPADPDATGVTVKAPTTDRAADVVESERRLLERLRGEMRNEAVLATLPEVVGTVDFQGLPALVTKTLPGAPMLTAYHRWRHSGRPDLVRADFAMAGRWLAAFHRATAGPYAPIEMDGGIRACLQDRFAGSPGIDEVLARLTEVLARLRRSGTTKSAVHGDFWCGNVLARAGRVSGVVDWEQGSARGEPVRDVVRFALAYALYLDRHTRPGRRVAGHAGLRAGPWGAGIRHAVRGEGWFPRLFRDFIGEGLVRLGAAPGLWRDAALAGLAEIAATADDEAFATHHLELVRSLSLGEGDRR
jgi:hypothetical protein